MARDLNSDGSFGEDEVFSYAKDHLGSVHALVDNIGRVVQRYEYSAYGKTKVEKTVSTVKLIKNPFCFTGRELDEETGDYYYRARYYSSWTGRFLSFDPIGFSGGINLYSYAKNNPLRYVDAYGLSENDVNRMRNVFKQSVQRLDQQGLRRPGQGRVNGMINNFQSSFGSKKLGCGAQADQTLDDITQDVLENGKFDDNWQFEIVNPNPFHQNIKGTSSNPTDPVLTIDPWMNQFSP